MKLVGEMCLRGMSSLELCAWLWAHLFLVTSSTANILPALSDLDFNRIKADQAHSHAAGTSPLVSLERLLVGGGYHRELVTTIRRVGVGEYHDDRVLIVENVTRDMYIDLDQVWIVNVMWCCC